MCMQKYVNPLFLPNPFNERGLFLNQYAVRRENRAVY